LAVPRALAAVSRVEALTTLSGNPTSGWRIGGGVTLEALAAAVKDDLPVVAEAIATVASSQVRSVATVAGNLLQTNRCWFLRSGFDCYKRRGGLAPCYAILGDHRFYHAAIDGHRCQSVTPSDLATALNVLGATVEVQSLLARREIPIEDFYVGPGETQMRPGEVLTALLIPAGAPQGVFEKLNLRDGDFAIASVALAARVSNGAVEDIRLCLGGLSPTPRRVRRVEAALKGAKMDPIAVRAALELELDRCAHPLAQNGWKLDAAAGLALTAAERLLRG